MVARIKKLRTGLLALCCLVSLGLGGELALAESAAPSYNYSYWGNAVAAPSAYEATTLITGASSGAGPFNNPQDIQVTADKQIYVLDSGNNRFVILDQDYKSVKTVDAFQFKGKAEKFNNPQGIYVTQQKEIYVADTGNKRIVHLDSDFKAVGIIEAPKSELLQANFEFQPVRVAVDKADRIYVMSAGVFDGFMEFGADGVFKSFIGANRVHVDAVEYFWKSISTKAQREQMVMYTPTEFTNLDINDEGFLYATNGDDYGDPIKKLNAQGADILRREGYYKPSGDLLYSTRSGGAPRLVDIDVSDSEIYAVLDASRGRVFTYNGDGYLLYIFGGIGNRLGEFNTPVAIEHSGDDILVLDQALGEITVFQTTEYGRTLNSAVRSYYNGDEEMASQEFRKVVNLNANMEYAYAGIGKAYLRQGEYKESAEYFERSMDRTNYSKAFLLYRKEVLRGHFSTIMTALIALVALWLGLRMYRKMKARKKVELH
ncbi:NHL repeat containing protein [Paenibacillus sp. FSL R7-277]|uniref:NHL repeat-containing protein n=1 Tax=Paenibacillus sp. FSL R7-277 TaxID=1227352 RepID=UPI0003E25BE3|nr:NHL repeat-containing protein [Paenibacillus sp. FSL R7-277]ETT73198.1 NHL repeat containing protein [Paenibacillus sp. FSL R7-277]